MIKKLLSKCLIIGSLAMCNLASAQYVFPTNMGVDSIDVLMITAVPPKPNHLSITTVFGKAEMKQTSVKSNGWLYGLRANYDLISSNNLYFGAELGYKAGELKGKTNSLDANNVTIVPVTYDVIIENQTKSKYSDLWAEIRVGYTFGNLLNGYVSPFALIGYEKEKEGFVSPSPMPIKNTLSYEYFGCGVTSNFPLGSQMNFGVNAKFKWMFDSKTKIGNSQYVVDKDVSSSNTFHWTIELPVTYLVSENISAGIAPFYEYKNYDKHKFERVGQEKAQFHMWGGLLNLCCKF